LYRVKNLKESNISDVNKYLLFEGLGSRIIFNNDDIGPDGSCSDCVAVNTLGCNGCSISDVMIGVEASNRDNPVDAIAIDIVENSGPVEVSSVNIQNVQKGIVVKSNGNTFSDLQIINVADDRDDCDPSDNTSAAIELVNSSNNKINNLMHRLSPGAITVWLNGDCNENELLNITVEQERLPGELICLDPSVYIPNINVFGNTVFGNYNGGTTYLGSNNQNFGTFCNNNTVYEIEDCEGGSSDNCN
jgi:hypothetical protein